jgi:hypothetical protein
LVDRLVAALDDSGDKDLFESTLSSADQHICEQVAATQYLSCQVPQELYLQIGDAQPLVVPKSNSLTDNLLRTTLGCEEKSSFFYLDSQTPTCRSSIVQPAARSKPENNVNNWPSGNMLKAIATAIWLLTASPLWQVLDWLFNGQSSITSMTVT